MQNVELKNEVWRRAVSNFPPSNLFAFLLFRFALIWGVQWDLNPRPPGPQPGVLTKLNYGHRLLPGISPNSNSYRSLLPFLRLKGTTFPIDRHAEFRSKILKVRQNNKDNSVRDEN